MANILITAIGSYSADIVIKTLKSFGHYLVGCDINPKEWIADAYNVNEFYQAPLTTSFDQYMEFIYNVCLRCNIHYIIPLTDPEVDVLSKFKVILDNQNYKVCTSDEDTIRLIRNKMELPKFLIENNIDNILPTISLQDDLTFDFPVFIKPTYGRSSLGCKVINDKEEYNYIKKAYGRTEYIVQPYINGDIITVDVIRDPATDETICICRKELLRNKSGAGLTIRIIKDMSLETLCTKISKVVNIIGAVNFEFIQNDKNKYFLEINPRFSGGVEFSHLAGYNVIENHLNCFSNTAISPIGAIRDMIIARKYEEYITRIYN